MCSRRSFLTKQHLRSHLHGACGRAEVRSGGADLSRQDRGTETTCWWSVETCMMWERMSKCRSRSNSVTQDRSLRKMLTGYYQTPQKTSKCRTKAHFYCNRVSRIAVAEAWAAAIIRVRRILKSWENQTTSRPTRWTPSKSPCRLRRKDHCSNSSQISGKIIGVCCSSSLSRTNLVRTTRRFSHQQGTTLTKRERSTLWIHLGRRAPSPLPPSVL